MLDDLVDLGGLIEVEGGFVVVDFEVLVCVCFVVVCVVLYDVLVVDV